MNALPDKSIAPFLGAFSNALQQEVYSCFQPIAQQPRHSAAQQGLRHLVSVGGLQVQDLPMSGNLQASHFLQSRFYLQALLSCFSLPVGRVYLVHQVPSQAHVAPIYQNAAHPLFYQTLYLDISSLANGGDNSLQMLSEQFLYQAPDSAYYLAVELLRPKHDAIFGNEQRIVSGAEVFVEHKLRQLLLLGIEQRPPLNIARARLDVLSQTQIEHGLAVIMDNCDAYLNKPDKQVLQQAGQAFLKQWQALLWRFAYDYQGEIAYHSALNQFCATLMNPVNALLPNMSAAQQQLSKHLLDTIAFQLNLFPPAPQRINRASLHKSQRRKPRDTHNIKHLPHFDRPVFIVSAPRSGSTLLFETLVQFNQLWSTGEENHAQLEAIKGLHPRDNQWHSNCLYAEHATAKVKESVEKMFMAQLQNKQQQHFLDLAEHERPERIRFVEKTPKNALRIPFIKALYPDALFIYLHREAKSNISSLIDGWRSQRFVAYRGLPENPYHHWSFLLIPEWRDWLNRSIVELATQQWQVSNRTIQTELAKLPAADWMSLEYQQLIDAPGASIAAISEFADFDWDADMAARCQAGLPVSRLTLSAPQQDKWLKHKYLLQPRLNARDHQRL